MTNIFRNKFTARELYEWFHANFPDSFSVQIFKDKNLPRGINPDYDQRVFNIFVNKGGTKKYRLYDSAIFDTHSGCENSYIDFLIEDEDANFYVGTWGYKRGDVEANYLLQFITIYLNTIHNREICKDEKSLV